MRKMKKILVVMLALAMTMAVMAGCGSKKDSKPAKDSKPEIVGTWKVSTVETAGVSVDFAKYAEQVGQSADSLKVELTAKEDKTFSMNLMGQKGDGTWEEKSGGKYVLSLEGDDREVTIKDEKLTLVEEASGVTMIFQKN